MEVKDDITTKDIFLLLREWYNLNNISVKKEVILECIELLQEIFVDVKLIRTLDKFKSVFDVKDNIGE